MLVVHGLRTLEIGTRQAGKLVNTTAGIATFDAGVATAIYDATITTPASGTTNGGMIARYVDATHYWYLALDDTNNKVYLYEINGSEPGDKRIDEPRHSRQTRLTRFD